ncbi:hypothetical protein AHAS_Ahas02G0147300 [Arachis hypogaea]
MINDALLTTGSYHVSRIGEIRGHASLLAALVESWHGFANQRQRAIRHFGVYLEIHQIHIFYFLGLTLFADKATTYAHVKSTLTVGAACLAHLYKALCCASQYDCNEMDDPFNLLFVWTLERISWIAPIPRQQLALVEIPVAQR